MTKEALLEGLLDLPTKQMEPLREPKDHELIEGNDGQVHYKMTKEEANVPGAPKGMVVFSLSLLGPKEEQLKFVNRLAQDLGSPLTKMWLGVQLFALWDARSVERRLTSRN